MCSRLLVYVNKRSVRVGRGKVSAMLGSFVDHCGHWQPCGGMSDSDNTVRAVVVARERSVGCSVGFRDRPLFAGSGDRFERDLSVGLLGLGAVNSRSG